MGLFRHRKSLFLDVAVADPTARTALTASTPSSGLAGVAAELRAARKVHKYGALCAGVGSSFFPAVIERFGACSDSLIGVIRTLAGVDDRDPLDDQLFTFSASSRVTFLAQRTVFACVLADAAMVSRLASADASSTPLLGSHPHRRPASVVHVTDAAPRPFLDPCPTLFSRPPPAPSPVPASPSMHAWQPSLWRAPNHCLSSPLVPAACPRSPSPSPVPPRLPATTPFDYGWVGPLMAERNSQLW